jgi:hypothetical protein
MAGMGSGMFRRSFAVVLSRAIDAVAMQWYPTTMFSTQTT